MGKSLFWAPIPVEPKNYCISYLDQALIKEVWGEDEKYNCRDTREVGKELLPFLRGVAASAGLEAAQDAKELIAAIVKHGKVEIFFKG